MDYTIKCYGALCELSVFIVNGIAVNPYDEEFYTKEDVGSGYAEPYCCGNMQGFPATPTDEVLAKYSITLEEFHKIATEAAEAVSFGDCGWCA